MNFKTISMGAAALALAATAASAQPATVSSSGNVCLKTIQIDHTQVPNAHTILFYMKDRKVWQNTLKNGDCVGLRFNGFIYEPTPPDQICGNLQIIRAIQTGSVCMLGDFTPYDGKIIPSKTMETEQPPPAPPPPDQTGN